MKTNQGADELLTSPSKLVTSRLFVITRAERRGSDDSCAQQVSVSDLRACTVLSARVYSTLRSTGQRVLSVCVYCTVYARAMYCPHAYTVLSAHVYLYYLRACNVLSARMFCTICARVPYFLRARIVLSPRDTVAECRRPLCPVLSHAPDTVTRAHTERGSIFYSYRR